MQFKDLKDKIQLTDANLVGITARKDNEPQTVHNGQDSWPADIFHPAAKYEWGTVDRVRGVLGRYLALYESVKGLAFTNYTRHIEQMQAGAPVDSGANDINLGRVKSQLLNIVFQPPTLNKATATAGSFVGSAKWLDAADGMTDVITLRARGDHWNNWGNKNPAAEGFFSHASPQNIKNFIANGGQGYQPAINDVARQRSLLDGLTTDTWGFPGEPAMQPTTIHDHTTILYGPVRDKAIRTESGMILDSTPVYNFYVQTSVSYESVIADSSVKEYHLSNVYYLQHELRNTGSSLLAPYHLDALTLGQNIPYFEVTNANTVTEANTLSYYHMYTNGLQDLLLDPVEFEKVDGLLSLNNKNLVVLHADLDALKKEAVHTSTLPFYNTIRIGNDPDSVTGFGNKDLLNALYNNTKTRGIIDLMQMYAVERLTTKSNKVITGSFAVSIRSPLSAEDASEFTLDASTDTPYEVLFDLEYMFSQLTANAGAQARRLANMINPPSRPLSELPEPEFQESWWINPDDVPPPPPLPTWEQDPVEATSVYNQTIANADFALIRDWNRDDMRIDPMDALRAQIAVFSEDTPETAATLIRGLLNVYRNEPAHAETLMYVIKKRPVMETATSTNVTKAVQTYYISDRFYSSAPTVYYDSQVKYNQKYQYDIYKVVLIFGNEYYYGQDVHQDTLAPNNIAYHVGVNNNASIKAVLVPHMIGGLPAAPIIDKPPMKPEISFYPFKGVNNKLLVLLNSNTGIKEEKPIRILQSDELYIEEEYFAQTQEILSYSEIVEQEKKLRFRTDDPIDLYQLFRLPHKPENYQDFEHYMTEVDPDYGIPGSHLDIIEPNRKYYYCARSIDVHRNVSNPTYIYELEMVDNNGQIFLKQKVFNFEKSKENFVKSGRRFIYIEPGLGQTIYDPAAAQNIHGLTPSLTVPPGDSILGDASVEDSVWGKGFKIRLTSKQTGRKLDLNINFKNSGKVKASE